MKLGTILLDGQPVVVACIDTGIIPLYSCKDSPVRKGDTLLDLIPQLPQLIDWFATTKYTTTIPLEQVSWLPPYTNPDKIWGIGLNYVEHAKDLAELPPQTYPASFMKPRSTIIGHGQPVHIPSLSHGTTGEAELGIIIGKPARDINRDNWLEYVAGFTTIIDMTAEDILRLNPRYLTLSKSFDTFFSFGPQIITTDEFSHDQVMQLQVSTMYNEQVHTSNIISNMQFPPDYLVWFHSQVMTLLPGDIISTGTPRAVHLHQGDTIGCDIFGFMPLRNPVS